MSTMTIATVEVSSHIFLLRTEEAFPIIDDGEIGPVFSLVGDSLVVRAGIAMGPARVALSTEVPDPLDGRPETGWEITEEATLPVNGDLYLTDPEYAVQHRGFSVPPGTYRIRVSCRGRTLAYEATVDEPVEDYLITLWRAEPAERVVAGNDGMDAL